MRMKKLLVLGDLGSVHLRKWTESMHDEYEVFAFTFAENNTTGITKGNVFFYRGWGHPKLWCVTAILSLLRFYRDISPDVVHVHYASSYGLLGSFLKTKSKVLSVWGSDVNYCKHSVLRRVLMRYTLASYPVVNCASQALSHNSQCLCSLPQYEVFQYGIDTSIAVKPDHIVGTNPVPVFILNRGFLDIYRADYVIREFDKFIGQGGKGKLVIFGYGNQVDTARVKKTVSDCINCEAIDFRGTVTQDELFNAMLEADYYISIPTTDGAPLALYEAMHIGLYPIVSDIESNHETFEQGEAAFMKSDKPDLLASLLLEVVSKPLTLQVIKHNRAIVHKTYSYQRNIQRMRKIYNQLLLK